MPRIAIATLAVAMSYGFATAAVDATPPVRSEGVVACLVQNLDSKPRTLRSATLLEFDGSTLSGCGNDAIVDPGEVKVLCQVTAPTFGAYCRFEGTSSKLRGFIRLMDTGGSSTRLVLPAD